MLKEKAKYNIATIAEMTGGITLSNKKDFQFRMKKWE